MFRHLHRPRHKFRAPIVPTFPATPVLTKSDRQVLPQWIGGATRTDAPCRPTGVRVRRPLVPRQPVAPKRGLGQPDFRVFCAWRHPCNLSHHIGFFAQKVKVAPHPRALSTQSSAPKPTYLHGESWHRANPVHRAIFPARSWPAAYHRPIVADSTLIFAIYRPDGPVRSRYRTRLPAGSGGMSSKTARQRVNPLCEVFYILGKTAKCPFQPFKFSR